MKIEEKVQETRKELLHKINSLNSESEEYHFIEGLHRFIDQLIHVGKYEEKDNEQKTNRI